MLLIRGIPFAFYFICCVHLDQSRMRWKQGLIVLKCMSLNIFQVLLINNVLN